MNESLSPGSPGCGGRRSSLTPKLCNCGPRGAPAPPSPRTRRVGSRARAEPGRVQGRQAFGASSPLARRHPVSVFHGCVSRRKGVGRDFCCCCFLDWGGHPPAAAFPAPGQHPLCAARRGSVLAGRAPGPDGGRGARLQVVEPRMGRTIAGTCGSGRSIQMFTKLEEKNMDV